MKSGLIRYVIIPILFLRFFLMHVIFKRSVMSPARQTLAFHSFSWLLPAQRHFQLFEYTYTNYSAKSQEQGSESVQVSCFLRGAMITCVQNSFQVFGTRSQISHGFGRHVEATVPHLNPVGCCPIHPTLSQLKLSLVPGRDGSCFIFIFHEYCFTSASSVKQYSRVSPLHLSAS